MKRSSSDLKFRFLVAYKVSGSAVAWGNYIHAQDFEELTEQSLHDIATAIRNEEEFSGLYGLEKSFVITNISYLGCSLDSSFKSKQDWRQPCNSQRVRGRQC